MVECERLYLEFFETELNAYFALACLAATRREKGRRRAATQAQSLAEVGYATLQRYLSDPMHTKHLNGGNRRELESKMKLFRETLDELQNFRVLKTAGAGSREFDWTEASTARVSGEQPIQAHEISNRYDSAELATVNPDNETVAALAYQFWLDRGCPIGSPEEDWLRAEAELRRRSKWGSMAALIAAVFKLGGESRSISTASRPEGRSGLTSVLHA